MNNNLCKGCREGIGPTLRYLIDIINTHKPKGIDERQYNPMKTKWLLFFGADIEVLSIEKKLNEIKERITKLEKNK